MPSLGLSVAAFLFPGSSPSGLICDQDGRAHSFLYPNSLSSLSVKISLVSESAQTVFVTYGAQTLYALRLDAGRRTVEHMLSLAATFLDMALQCTRV